MRTEKGKLGQKSRDIQFPDFALEKELWVQGHTLVAGTDEAGRGCLAGPVVAAAVILKPDFVLDGVRDSKIIAENERGILETEIKNHALAWAVASCSPEEIDSLNILWASMEAMARAVDRLQVEPTFVLADGNHISPDRDIPWKPIVKGDSRSLSVAAASILAKTERDRIMKTFALAHAEYGWDTNFGYPTEHHYEALALHGSTALHRKSFRLFDTQFDLFKIKKVPPKKV